MRLIDADAAENAIKETYCKDCDSYNGVRCRACNFDDALIAIDSVPTLDYAPVRHGEWIEDEFEYPEEVIFRYKCSECGRTELVKEPYCHCGARMDGGERDG